MHLTPPLKFTFGILQRWLAPENKNDGPNEWLKSLTGGGAADR